MRSKRIRCKCGAYMSLSIGSSATSFDDDGTLYQESRNTYQCPTCGNEVTIEVSERTKIAWKDQ